MCNEGIKICGKYKNAYLYNNYGNLTKITNSGMPC